MATVAPVSDTFPQAGGPPVKKTKMFENRYATSPQFINMLLHTKAESVRNANNVIMIVNRDETVMATWTGLNRYGFLSCPVVNKTGQKYYGFIDLMDIVEFVIKTFGQGTLETAENYWEMVKADETFQKRTVREIMAYPLSFRSPFHPVLRGFSLLSALELMARLPNVHRIPVIDEQRRLYCVLTQSRVAQLLWRNVDKLGDVASKPIGDFRNAVKEVVRAQQTELALEAFRRMVTAHVTGVAVVNADGRLVEVLSTKDLKIISPDGRLFWRMFQQIAAFVKDLDTAQRPGQLVTVQPTNTLSDVIRLMVQNKVHRVFVVDDAMRPVGVVTVKDVLWEILDDPMQERIELA
eukprot:TRINITY_DN22357_c0_g1_i1.p2 TRINITY_DN22357_c0_g1~~TRINITY_DN22357_c0_g1_i1.p2  ORF type:complete len:351 (-),score=152.56 TRINITY_DN22357_c0_g1_i1:65-1117(-)